MSFLTQEEVSERIEHRDALLDIQAVAKTPYGRRFFKYLLKHHDPIFLPPQGIEGPLLFEGLGMRRAYIELFNLVAEADPAMASELLAAIVKERNEKNNREDDIDNGGKERS